MHPRVSVAAGFDAVRSVVDFTNGLPTLIGGDVRLAGGTWGYGFNVAGLYKISPGRLHVALTYRSRVKLDFNNGRANFSPANPDFAPVLPDQGGTASITLPDIITAGIMGRPRADLALTFDANLVLWSTYDRIDINFQTAPDRAIVSNGRNTVTLRGGADWTFPARWPGLHLRGGLIYDRGAIPSSNLGPGLPDSDRIDVAARRRLRPGPLPRRPRLSPGRLPARRRHRRPGRPRRHVQDDRPPRWSHADRHLAVDDDAADASIKCTHVGGPH